MGSCSARGVQTEAKAEMAPVARVFRVPLWDLSVEVGLRVWGSGLGGLEFRVEHDSVQSKHQKMRRSMLERFGLALSLSILSGS